MRLLHDLAKIHASFDDPSLSSRAALVPVMALAQRAGLNALAGRHVRSSHPCGVNADLKVACLVAGMVAGADGIDDMDLLRHGAMGALFGGIQAPSTLGSFLRSFTWGHVLQAGEGEPAAAARPGALRPAAARQGRPLVRRYRLAAKASLRAQEARRRLRPHQDPGQGPAGARAERAGGHHQHAARRPGNSGHAAVRRQRRLGPRRRVVCPRSGQHRAGHRVPRDIGGAG